MPDRQATLQERRPTVIVVPSERPRLLARTQDLPQLEAVHGRRRDHLIVVQGHLRHPASVHHEYDNVTARAITVRQPWASLIAVGAKTIIDQAKPTDYRGPLLIHARKAGGVSWDDDPDLWKAITTGTTVEAFLALADTLPLGAVVASCVLADCVPIVDADGCKDGTAHLCVVNENGLLHSPLDRPWADGETEHLVSDQLPFGDFSPGGYAWLLEDVKATSERCPRCNGTGHLPHGDDWQRNGTFTHCETCDGAGRCPPVPMRGHQGLWTPNWEVT